jgi:hypothetical protein
MSIKPGAGQSDTSDTSFMRSQEVSNQCHDTSDTGSNKSGNGKNQIEKNEQASDIIAREEATLAVAKKSGEGS